MCGWFCVIHLVSVVINQALSAPDVVKCLSIELKISKAIQSSCTFIENSTYQSYWWTSSFRRQRSLRYISPPDLSAHFQPHYDILPLLLAIPRYRCYLDQNPLQLFSVLLHNLCVLPRVTSVDLMTIRGCFPRQLVLLQRSNPVVVYRR